MTRPIAALTGATGFLGAHLVRALDAAGFAVRALARRTPSPPGWGGVVPDIVPGDLSDAAALGRLVEGAAVVVHCAAAIKAPDLAGFMAVNRDGTIRLAQAVLASTPDARFLLVSSLAARSPEISGYAASKQAAESAAANLFAPERLTIARPPAIFGPGDRETLTLFRAAAASPVLPVLSEHARLTLMHVADAAAQIAALAARDAVGGTYALAGAQPGGHGWREIMAALGDAVGRRPLLLPVSPGLLRGLALLSVAAARAGGGAPLLSNDKLRELLHHDWAVGGSEMAEGLPAPRYTLGGGFASTVSWYRQAGWLR